MTWEDRLREAAYTSPSGTRLTFDYEDVRRTVEKKTAGFTFPDANGTYVQDLGHAGRQYPLRLFFWGADHDTEADTFEAALLEAGPGRLEHPRYGAVTVVPFGKITQRDDLKTGANQTIIEVVFWATTGVVYPTGSADPAAAVTAAVDAYNTAAAETLENSLDLNTTIERVVLESQYQSLLDSAESELQAVADTQDDVRQQFDAIVASINAGLGALAEDAPTLAAQTTLLIQTPALAPTGISARLTAYADLANAIISGDGAVVSPGYDGREANSFYTSDLYASTYVTGSVVSAINTQFETKNDALDAAEEILAQLAAVVEWRDANHASLEAVDTGQAYQQLQEAVALAAGFLVEISFTLKQERSLVLDRARTIIDLAAELYGSVDDQLDFLIQSNKLTGSEILELPKGRTIVYYV